MKHSLSIFIIFSGIFQAFIFQPAFCQTDKLPPNQPFASQPFLNSAWVDSVLNSLSLEEKIAQLLMIRVHTDKDEAYYKQIEQLVKKHNIGGVSFFKGGPVRQVQLTNRLQDAAKTPLLIAMDAEWGPSMRLDSTITFPRQMTLGAIENDSLIYEMGLEIGRQLKRLGVHINFAPVIDVNNNPLNPVINFRSFGENRQRVAFKGLAYMNGLQDAGIIACAKHFPGHGDTNADSHYTLPLLRHTFEEIDSIHLFPFKELIHNGLHAVMVAHLQIPALEPGNNVASTLSKDIVTGLLQRNMGFSGLVITDALDMRGVSDYYKSGELELQALMAGNDILLLPEDIPAAVNTIKKAIENGLLEPGYLEKKCRKVLAYKQLVKLDQPGRVAQTNLISDLNTDAGHHLNKRLVRASISLVKNKNDLMPLKELAENRIASVSVGTIEGNDFQKSLAQYGEIDRYAIPKNHDSQQAASLQRQLKDYNIVIVSVHNNSMFPSRQYGINRETTELVSEIAKKHKVVLCIFANPYSLDLFRNAEKHVETILIAYQDGKDFEVAAAQAIFGGLPVEGMLPVTAGKEFPEGTGIKISKSTRLGFGDALDVGISPQSLYRIDSLARLGIDSCAYPGCQVVLIKDGIVFYNKAFGNHTYTNGRQVLADDIYDLASLTKIAATSAVVMHLADRGKINVDKTLGHYLPNLKGSDKENITLREVMAHQARLRAWIPFYEETLNDKNLNPACYSHLPSKKFPVEVARNLFLHKDFNDTIFARIKSSPLNNHNNYVYSDLGFILLAEIIEKQSGMPLNDYAEKYFFRPLGLTTAGFLPLSRFSPDRITPTENDTLFRKQLIHGYVHDPSAAMLGGVSGHAGLFSNAMDIAVMMQMFLQGGVYGDERYIDEATLREFTRVQFPGQKNRRGLGFDKPEREYLANGPAARSASSNSYGHSGFTGTYAWADPAENLIYVFLSNRVYPDAGNRAISRLNIRTEIHQAAYDALKVSRETRQVLP